MRRRTSIVVATVVIVVMLGAGALAINEGGPGEPGTRPGTPVIEPAEVEATTATPAPSRSKPRARRHKRARAALPVRVQIPSIGVDARLVSLGIDATGALEAPKTFSDAGWWSGGTRPGDPGPAVIAGHVDSKTGPAVFFRLRDLHRGDAIVVTRRDGSRVRFTVQRSASYPKSRFPTHAVYGPTARPALRLITCSGTFDRSSGHYLDNTVVFAAA